MSPDKIWDMLFPPEPYLAFAQAGGGTPLRVAGIRDGKVWTIDKVGDGFEVRRGARLVASCRLFVEALAAADLDARREFKSPGDYRRTLAAARHFFRKHCLRALCGVSAPCQMN